jgi:hypothetical protein
VKLIPFVSALVAIAGSLWSPLPAGAQNPQRSLLRQLYGDLAFEVSTRGQGTVTLAAADARTQVVISLMSTDLRRWSDSATRMLAAAPPRRGRSASWNAIVEGPGVVAGSMSLTRSIAPGDTNLVLLVTDTAFKAIRTSLTMTDAKALAAAMKRAALASLPTRPTPMPAAPPAKKPPK